MRGYISIGKTLLNNTTKSSCQQLLNGARARAVSSAIIPMQQSKQSQFAYVASNQIRTIFTSSARLGSTLQFKLADIGEGIAEVSIKEWYVKVGDTVKQFDKICEVQSDKATVTITSRYDGLITKIYYNVDDTAFVGKPLVDIEVEGADGGKSSGQQKHSETISDSLERIEAPPAAVTPPSSDFRVNKVLATPAVRKMAMDYKLNITDIPGSGKDGRVLKEDVIRYMENAGGSKTTPAPPKTVEQPVQHQRPQQATTAPVHSLPARPVTVHLAADRKEAIKGVRKAMARTMTLANQIPHFSYCDEYNMNTLVEQRGFFKHMAKERGISLSYMPFIIKACSMSLHSYPLLNAYVDEKCDNITYKAAHNIGVAIDTPDGLIVPNIKNVESKSIFEIAHDLNRLQSLATASKLAPSDLNGGTFTISNIGSIGGTYMKPVILPPEVAIGALGKIQKVPRFDHENKIVPVNLMQVSWSADHRVVDGATMARFSNQVKKYIENLNLLLVDLK